MRDDYCTGAGAGAAGAGSSGADSRGAGAGTTTGATTGAGAVAASTFLAASLIASFAASLATLAASLEASTAFSVAASDFLAASLLASTAFSAFSAAASTALVVSSETPFMVFSQLTRENAAPTRATAISFSINFVTFMLVQLGWFTFTVHLLTLPFPEIQRIALAQVDFRRALQEKVSIIAPLQVVLASRPKLQLSEK